MVGLRELPGLGGWGNATVYGGDCDFDILATVLECAAKPSVWQQPRPPNLRGRVGCCFRQVRCLVSKSLPVLGLSLALPHHAQWLSVEVC